jgi:hypothetical protein
VVLVRPLIVPRRVDSDRDRSFVEGDETPPFEMGGVYITTKRVCVGGEAMLPNYFGRAA